MDQWGNTLHRVSVHVQQEIDGFLDSLLNPTAGDTDHSFFAQADDPPPPPPNPNQRTSLLTNLGFGGGGGGGGGDDPTSSTITNWMNDDFWEDTDMEMQNMATDKEREKESGNETEKGKEKVKDTDGLDPDFMSFVPSAPALEEIETQQQPQQPQHTHQATIDTNLDALFDELLTPTNQREGEEDETTKFFALPIEEDAFAAASAPPFIDATASDDETGVSMLSRSMVLTLREVRKSENKRATQQGQQGQQQQGGWDRKPVPRGRGKGAPQFRYDNRDNNKMMQRLASVRSVRDLVGLQKGAAGAAGARKRATPQQPQQQQPQQQQPQHKGRGAAEVGKIKKSKGGRHWPIWTVLVALAEIAMMIVVLVENNGFEPFGTNPWGGPSKHVLLDYGAKYSPYIRDCKGQCYKAVYYDHCGGDWWRFISATFLHIGIGQLVLNLLIMFRIGWQLERQYGTLRVAPIFLLSGIAGNIASGILLPNIVSVGSSGALFGFVGVLLADLIHNWAIILSPIRNLLFIFFGVVIALLLGFLPGVDNFTNVVGLIEGVLSGLIFLPSIAGRTRKCHQGLRWTLVVIMVPVNIVFFGMLLMLFYSCVHCEDCKIVTCIPVLDFCTAK